VDEESRTTTAGLSRQDVGRRAALAAVAEYAPGAAGGHTIVLVEGASDQAALAALADRGGRRLAAEEPEVRRGLKRAGLTAAPDRPGSERVGFFVCVDDLEDELIRSLGADRTVQVVAEQGELGSFRTFVQQPFHRGRTREQQLHRFMGTRGGRKIHYARMLADALDLSRIPARWHACWPSSEVMTGAGPRMTERPERPRTRVACRSASR
jgi:hypothetical protein